MEERDNNGAQSKGDLFAEAMINRAKSFFRLDQNENKLFLELGCGHSCQEHGLHIFNNQLVGIDLNFEFLEYAKANYKSGYYVQGDIQELPFKEASFDFIFSYSVFQYVDWRVVAEKCMHILRPGGKAVFVENLAGNPVVRIFRVIRTLLRWRFPPYQIPRNYIDWSELAYFKGIFPNVDFAAFHLLTPLDEVIPMLKRKKPKSSTRLYPILQRIDTYLIKRFPKLEPYCWRVVVCADKIGHSKPISDRY